MSSSSSSSSSPYRVSRLPPPPSIPLSGPSTSPQRFLYFGVRRGTVPGVYTSWNEATTQVVNHPDPALKTFSSKLAAEAYVAGWDGAGRHSLPSSTPRPLRDHLAMSFPGSVNAQSPASPRRQSYHARLLSMPSELGSLPLDTSISTLRQGSVSRSSYRNSMVRISSPLRQQVDDEDEVSSQGSGSSEGRRSTMMRAASFVGVGGLLSPPHSPEGDEKILAGSVMDRERPTTRRNANDSGPWSSRGHRDFSSAPQSALGLTGLKSPPNSPQKPTASRRASANTTSGLWADSIPQPPTPVRAATVPQPDFVDSTAPKFSRSALKKSGVVMPVSAKRSSSSLSFSGNLFSSPNGSSSSLASSSSNGSDKTVRRPSQARTPSFSRLSHFPSQDRLESLAETSMHELNGEGSGVSPSLLLPRPAFMRRVSSVSSISSNDSFTSMGSMTSGSSEHTSSLDSCEPITEETEPDVHIRQAREDEMQEQEMMGMSCTKSDGDASVDSGSMKYVKTGKKGGGGLFKRLSKVFKKSDKVDTGRRESF
ncbi:hypothetical protein B9479_003261 [Cryptococcus floricola]|uniref:Ribonuclease H1 N-terminal domain-containing protein n=1 Tax=Cryptococcus floricola TaxID=2591691 RepID=A0A5D3B0S9_9TREE|nr:hypothetical protein B9479_003261 [Cryptococcus floricola]